MLSYWSEAPLPCCDGKIHKKSCSPVKESDLRGGCFVGWKAQTWDPGFDPRQNTAKKSSTDRSYKYPMDSQAASDYFINITLPVSLSKFFFSTGFYDTVPRRFLLQEGINKILILFRHHLQRFPTLSLEHYPFNYLSCTPYTQHPIPKLPRPTV
jgi:hypothetical protein